jgi:hypothetical protein
MRDKLSFVAAGAVLVTAMVVLPGGAPFSIDAGAKTLQTLAFARDHGWPRPIPYPAAALDPDGRFLPPFLVPASGGAASVYPVLFPLAAAPLALVGGVRALKGLPFVAGLATAWMVGLLVRRLTGGGSPAPPAAIALLATPLAFYSLTFWEQTLAALLVLAALLLVIGRVEAEPLGAPVRWAGAGALLGLACWVRTELLVLVPLVLAVPLLLDRWAGLRAALTGGGGAAAGALAGAVVQRLTLGVWLPLHLVYHTAPFARGGHLLEECIATFLGSMTPDPVTAVASLVWVAAVVAALHPRTRTTPASRLLGAVAVVAAVVAALIAPGLRWLAGVRPTEAFPYAAPVAAWILLAPLPLAIAARTERVRDRRWQIVALLALLFVVAVSLAKPARSPEWGHRLLLPSVLLATAALLALEPLSARAPRLVRGATLAALAAAVVVQAGGVVLLGHGTAIHAGLVRSVLAATADHEVIVTDTAMLPLGAGADFASRRFLFCASDGAFAQALGRLSAIGEAGFAFASVRGLAQVSLDPGATLDTAGRSWRRADHQVLVVGGASLTIEHYLSDRGPP